MSQESEEYSNKVLILNEPLAMSTKDNEKLYEEKIRPLMAQIIAVCMSNGIPVVSAFQLNESMTALTVLPFDNCDMRLKLAAGILTHARHLDSSVSTVDFSKAAKA